MIRAGTRILAEEGVHNLSLRKTAALAGVSTGAPYRHFSGKEALLAAIAEEGFKKLVRKVNAARRRAGGNHRRLLLEAGGAYVDFAVRNPDYLRIMFGSEIADREPYPDLAQASRESYGQLVEIITELRNAGFIKKKWKAESSALALWSTIHGLSTLMIENQLVEAKTRKQKSIVTRSILRILLAGLH